MTETKKTRIAIAGIGGIGGYIGGKLAYYYSNIDDVEIIFIARGEMAEAINKKGLELESKGTSYKCMPALTSDNPLEIGIIDILIVCTKNFSVEELFEKYSTSLTSKSIVITTQNTVNGKEIITPYLPYGATLMEGSIYIASNVIKPGKIEHVSGPAKLFFGTDGNNDSRGDKVEKILNDAGIDATYTTNIKSVLWKKFMFVSPAAIVTALFQITFSEIVETTKSEYLFINLISELMQLSTAKKIAIDDNTVLNNINLLGNFKGNVKSSFQLDLEKNKHTEINSLVKYVIEEAKLFQVPTPHFDSALTQLCVIYKNLKKT
ncbi:ketopantoate reductase family protein [Flavobacterium sp.]|uniref:ketopantoate reductase family protein n=1 Tax=Flavobacterium sp. TaxID=239 RepID=UPI0038FC53B4